MRETPENLSIFSGAAEFYFRQEGGGVDVNPQSQAWVQQKLRDYYARGVRFPPEPLRREWAFMAFDRSMERHLSFRSEQAILDHLRLRAPLHAFYSSAYFQRPEADMKRKGWRGADLFFDLDLDPKALPPEQRTYEAMLARVKEETLKLLAFLVEDLALRDLAIVFSGKKGYHIHARDPKVLPLGSGARRELIDYVTANGLQMERFLGSEPELNEATGRPVQVARLHAEGGWGRRLQTHISGLLDTIAATEEGPAIAMLKERFHLTAPKARLLRRLALDPRARALFQQGALDQIADFPWERLAEGLRVEMLARPDELVTGDIHRLARLATSIHGDTSLRVTPLTVDRLPGFDPLREAVAFGDDPVKVEVTQPHKIRLKTERYTLEPGPREVPEHVAMHLLCMGKAEVA
ncbi:MAG: DNA primase catalytic subunit PriS [Euryarchaeota archaeon]|nr:DNA primase catalytic subunit PriS [Euryarchaeota archaeon]